MSTQSAKTSEKSAAKMSNKQPLKCPLFSAQMSIQSAQMSIAGVHVSPTLIICLYRSKFNVPVISCTVQPS